MVRRVQTAGDYQWVRQFEEWSLGAGTPTKSSTIVLDQAQGLTFPVRLVRSFITVSLRWDLAQLGGKARWFSLGAVRTDPKMPAATLGALDMDEVDRSWVYRQDYRLPYLADNEAGNGSIGLQGEPYHLDWQYRGGKGTLVTKDVEIRLIASTDLPTGTLRVGLAMLHLFVS